MKTNAKYLFDEDFSTGEKPTITLVEAERRRADAEFVEQLRHAAPASLRSATHA